MLKRRFVLYLVVCFIVALISVSYVGYRAYQNHVEFKAFMSNALALNRSVEAEHDHSSHGHTNEKTDPPSVPVKIDGEYVYDINGLPVYSKEPLDPKMLNKAAWVLHGTMTASVEQQIKNRPDLSDYVVQRVVTPDGEVRSVFVPQSHQYKEGDAIHESEIIPVPGYIEAALLEPPQKTITWDGVEYPYPDEYYKIEDRYERELYFEKFVESVERNISMDEVEKKIAGGEISLSQLSENARLMVDNEDKLLERANMLSPKPSGFSDNMPVKVRFLNDGNPKAGWERKLKSDRQSEVDDVSASELPLSTEAFSSEGLPLIDTAPVRKGSESDSSSRSALDIEQQLTPKGIEAELSNGVSTDPQQLIDQYGTEEGLRRLRESDPEAARQFEQEQRGAPSRDVPDGEQSESGSKD